MSACARICGSYCASPSIAAPPAPSTAPTPSQAVPETTPGAVRGHPSPNASVAAVPARGVIEPTSEARYRIQLNAGASLRDKLELLRALTSHSNPSGDLAVVIERAVDLALEQVQRERFATTEKPRERSKTRLAKTARSKLRRGHIPHATQREIATRDELRCTYVGADGHRCTAKHFLQIHHEHAWARGGSDEGDNLRLLCGRHNRLLAEQDFGAAHIAAKTAARGNVAASAEPREPDVRRE